MLSHCQEHTTLPLQMQHMNAIDMSSHQKMPLLRAEPGRTEGSLLQPNLAKGRKLRPLPSTTMYSYVVWIILSWFCFSFVLSLELCAMFQHQPFGLPSTFLFGEELCISKYSTCTCTTYLVLCFNTFFPRLWLGLKILHLHRFTCNCRYGSKSFTCTCLIPRFSFLPLY
jgi:hypothetical protein